MNRNCCFNTVKIRSSIPTLAPHTNNIHRPWLVKQKNASTNQYIFLQDAQVQKHSSDYLPLQASRPSLSYYADKMKQCCDWRLLWCLCGWQMPSPAVLFPGQCLSTCSIPLPHSFSQHTWLCLYKQEQDKVAALIWPKEEFVEIEAPYAAGTKMEDSIIWLF